MLDIIGRVARTTPGRLVACGARTTSVFPIPSATTEKPRPFLIAAAVGSEAIALALQKGRFDSQALVWRARRSGQHVLDGDFKTGSQDWRAVDSFFGPSDYWLFPSMWLYDGTFFIRAEDAYDFEHRPDCFDLQKSHSRLVIPNLNQFSGRHA